MPHFCADEFIALMMVIPFLRYFAMKLHAKFKKSDKHNCHLDEENHDEHQH